MGLRHPVVALCSSVWLLVLVGMAHAAPITFDFVFQQPGGPAQAVGFITFEETLLPNPAGCVGPGFDLPDPAVLALQVTVSGAVSGNGTFGLDDFDEIAWCTNGGTLNLSAQLVGQPTPGDPWGTPSGGNGGDFNLFGDPPSPDGRWYFTLCADGSEENCMELTSMLARRSALAPAPALSATGLFGLIIILLGIGATALRRRA